jgi:acyl-CoA synthetase (AMP-forming)/AMP-acid ligase II
MRFPDFLDKQTLATPDVIAVTFGDHDYSYREIRDKSRAVAGALNASGIPPRAKVASWLTNCPAFFAIQTGIHRTQFVWMPINPRATADECIANIEAFDAKWLFIDARFSADLKKIAELATNLQGIVVVNGSAEGFASFDDFCRSGTPPVTDADVGPRECVTLVTTGGTTGKPKGIARINSNWSTLVTNYRLAAPVDGPLINLVATPLTHVAGDIALSVFARGGINIVMERPTPEAILLAIHRHRVNYLFVPPTMLYMMLASPSIRDFDYSSLRYLMYGAAPISRDKLMEAWRVFGPVMTQLYGLMEATSTVSIMTPEEHLLALGTERFGSIGRGSPMVMMDVVNDAGISLPVGEKGEIVCRGANLCAGYEGNKEASQAAFRNGWFYSGDIGVKDEMGYVSVVDRSKDIIISGGFNIFPGEVEQVIWMHPAVQDCAVVGRAHEKWGEQVTAVIELKAGCELDTDELLAACKAKLGSIKAPKQILIWNELPRSNVGKVLKKDIRIRLAGDEGAH